MTARQQKIVLLTTSGTLLALLLALTIVFVLPAISRRHAEAARSSAALKNGWHQQNVAVLTDLSAVRNLSLAERQRFEEAGDDPNRMREALIEIHEARLANSSRDLADAQARRSRLGDTTGYAVYGDQPTPADLVALINDDERAATDQIALLAAALTRIRAWQPVAFAAYVAAHPTGTPLLPTARASDTPEATPANVAPSAPDRTPVPTPAVPDSRATPVDPANPTAVPVPNQSEIAVAARHPSLTVYADNRRPTPPGTAVDDTRSGAPLPLPATRTSSPEDTVAEGNAEAEIKAVLERWASAMTLNNPHAESAEYAPHLDRYFLRKDVDHAFVEADKAAYLKRGNVTAGFTIQDIDIQNETRDSADIRLTKNVTWQRGAEGQAHQLIRSHLQVQRINGRWKITAEQDLR